jgi:hypothetical protein
MNRPRIFLSAVSEELRTARKNVAATVRTLGYDPVSQDDFPTGYGELPRWLMEQIDSCEGLIQLVGQAYGAEPPEADPAYGRVSYTQFEFLYACQQQKKTWVIVAGEGCRRDQPVEELDLPREAGHPDPAGYQAERRHLQEDYRARLKGENHLRHTAMSDTELQNIVLRLRDELRELWQGEENKYKRLMGFVAAILLGLVLLGGGIWLVKHLIQKDIQQAGVVNTAKIRAHLLHTAEETHRRELAEAETARDWQERQRLREAADQAHTVRLSRIEELAAAFAEIEGRGSATSVFQEMSRILAEQGVDEAIAYVGAQRAAILQTVQARAAAAREKNRADLQPLLKTAALHQTKGQAGEARALYADVLAAEPDWPEALHAAFRFHVDQGDFARVHNTLAEVRREYEAAQGLAQRLTAADPSNTQWRRDLVVSNAKLGDVARARGQLAEAAQAYSEGLEIMQKLAAADPSNTQWQRDLAVSYSRLANLAERRQKAGEAQGYWQQALEVLARIEKRGLHLSPEDREWLEWLRRKIGAAAP